jgi:hypothetical protein
MRRVRRVCAVAAQQPDPLAAAAAPAAAAAATTLAAASLAAPSLAAPSLAAPSLAAPSLAAPSLAAPSLAAPALAAPARRRRDPPVRATRARAPGGSFIWPYTSVHLDSPRCSPSLMTPCGPQARRAGEHTGAAAAVGRRRCARPPLSKAAAPAAGATWGKGFPSLLQRPGRPAAEPGGAQQPQAGPNSPRQGPTAQAGQPARRQRLLTDSIISL